MPIPAIHRSRYRPFALLVVFILLFPLLLTPLPQLSDYPNHLARAYLIAFRDRYPELQAMYSVHWAIIPNLILDIILPPLMHVLPVLWAGKCAVALSVLAPVLGTAAYHRAGFGRASLWPWASGIIAYNATLLIGLLNFTIAIGFALLATAIYLRMRERTVLIQTIALVVSSVIIFFTHILGVAFLFFLIGLEELSDWMNHRRSYGDTKRQTIVIALSALAPIFLYLQSATHDAPFSFEYSLPTAIIWQLFFPVIAYFSWEKLLAIIAVAIFYLYLRNKKIALRTAPLAGAALLLIGAIILPGTIKTTTIMNGRLATTAAFIFWAGVSPRNLSCRERSIGIFLTTSLLIARVALIGFVWLAGNKDLNDINRVFRAVPADAKVAVVRLDRSENQPYWSHMRASRRLDGMFLLTTHLPALLLIDRHAFWPFFFATPGKQPVSVNQPYASLAFTEGMPPAWTILTEPRSKQPRYLQDWRHQFDYVVLMYAGGLKTTIPSGLQLIASSDVANLYRITR